jgi:hypothetical protein
MTGEVHEFGRRIVTADATQCDLRRKVLDAMVHAGAIARAAPNRNAEKPVMEVCRNGRGCARRPGTG